MLLERGKSQKEHEWNLVNNIHKYQKLNVMAMDFIVSQDGSRDTVESYLPSVQRIFM